MKNLILKVITILYFTFTITSAIAQTEFKKHSIKLNVAPILFGDGNLAYEMALNEKNSVSVNTAFGFIENEGTQYQLNGLTLGYRFYFKGDVNKGFFAAGEVGVARISANDKIIKETTTGYLWRLYGGYKHTFKKGLTLEAGVGADGLGNKFERTQYNGFYVPFYVYPNLGIGYSF